MRDVLSEIGWVGAVIENKRTGNLIDGHLRIEEALSQNEDEPVPYILVDLSPEEESLILATYDPIGDLATRDYHLQQELLRDLQSEQQALDALLESMRADAEQAIEAAGNTSGDKRSLTIPKHAIVKAVISVEQAGIIESALASTSLRNRGEALTEICREYLLAKGQFDILTESQPEKSVA